MNKIVLALSLAVLVLFSIIVAGSLLLDLGEDGAEEAKLYTFSISVDDRTYTVGVRSNYSVSEVSYFGILRYVSVDFRGSLRATVFCEIIVPADLIWGELFVYKKGYLQSDDSYVLSNNGTHHFVEMAFKHIATVEVISIRGTEGVVESSEGFVVTSATASPSNSTPGLVSVVGEIKNNGIRNETVLVVMQIKEPNGDVMSIENNSLLLDIPAGETRAVEFEPRIPLNVKIGIFKVNIEVYDQNQIAKYYSTGFNCTFTTPIRYRFHFDRAAKIDFSMTVDGVFYPDDATFYWYLRETHRIVVPHIVMVNDVYGWIFDGWGGPDGNVLELTVTADHPTDIEISYGLYYP